MAKGDSTRTRNRIDEQMKQSQGYLTGLQQLLASQYGNFNNLYWGGGSGSQPYGGSTFGYGSTTPHFSWTGDPYYSGEGTDTPSPISGSYGMGYAGSGQSEGAKEQILSYLRTLGPATSQNLERALPEIQKMFPGTRADTSGGPLDELNIPGVGLVDFIQGAEGGNPNPDWIFNTSGGGAFGGGYGGFGGGIPGMTISDYNNIMSMYGDLFGDVKGKYGGFLGAAQNMASTGGLSEGDKANLRSRAISPVRAVYENALRNVNQQKAIQGGYSPGYTTAMGRFNREMGQGVSDATTNAEAAIAEMVQRGKLGGLSAWGSGLSGYAGGLGGLLGGMTGLYSATPGLASTFGNQALAASGQQLQAAGLQNALSLGLINAQNQASGIPGNFQSAMGNIGSALQLGKTASDIAYPWFNNSGAAGGMGMGTTVSPGTSIGYAGGIDPNTMFSPGAYSSGAPGAYTDYAANLSNSPLHQPNWTGTEFKFGGDNQSNYGSYFSNYRPYTGGGVSNPQWSGANPYPWLSNYTYGY